MVFTIVQAKSAGIHLIYTNSKFFSSHSHYSLWSEALRHFSSKIGAEIRSRFSSSFGGMTHFIWRHNNFSPSTVSFLLLV